MSSVGTIAHIDKSLREYRDLILKGKLLAIDPSTGSTSSLPGYAIYEAGVLVESGLIQVSVAEASNKRLYEINRTLREEFEIPDVLVIEHISEIAFGVLKFKPKAFCGLHRGVGAILSAFNVDPVIAVPPRIWKKTVDENYVKSDESDAVYIGRHVILGAIALVDAEKAAKTQKRKSKAKKQKSSRSK